MAENEVGREGGHFLIPEPESSGSLGLHDVPSNSKRNHILDGLDVKAWLSDLVPVALTSVEILRS